jgi:hypothetical protein
MVSLLCPVATKNKNKTRLAVVVLGPSPQPAAVLTEIYPTTSVMQSIATAIGQSYRTA